MDIFIPQNSMAWKIKVMFKSSIGCKEYITPDVRMENPGWSDETFNHPILQLEFFLPTGHTLILKGMEKYNFFIEAFSDLGGKYSDARMQSLCFAGKYPFLSTVDLWKIGEGRTTFNKVKYMAEWYNTPISGWRNGVIGNHIMSAIVGNNYVH